MENIPIEISSYLLEIAERLWSGHAAVMVGSGFSKNAKKSDPTKRDIPDWNQLGDIFYEKIYGRRPNEKERYLNVMKLANEVEAAFGRPVLDQMMREYIPDKEYEPSELHVRLLELPWSDIFTTNYDTLLERSREFIINQKFDVVVNKQDLIYAERPRIIKLHGSFPFERPLIVTEEDYRTYPKYFAPFVNTVQQSLLENTLCLIGFSGDDPNFLHWIGWINDNLSKENSPKIYLVGLLSLSDAKKKLLESKNIVLVDFSKFVNFEDKNSHQNALVLFLSFLESAKKKGNNLNWPGNKIPFVGNYNEDSIKEIVENWENERLKFPNWLILSEDKRETLWKYTNHIINRIDKLEKSNLSLDIHFWHELNWRLEKCLCPLFNNFVPLIENILNQYEFINNKITSINENGISETHSIKDIKEKWLELQFALLRYYREENFQDKWLTLQNLLESYLRDLSPEQTARFYYEQSLQALFNNNISQLQNKLTEWPENSSLPYWECKRAGLLAEIGKIEEAERILERSLTFIRNRLNLSPVVNDYTWVSQEAYVIFLARIIKSGINNTVNKVDHKVFQDRERYLTQFESDPYNEYKLFRIKLEFELESKSLVLKKSAFDINRTSSTYRISASDKDTLTGYAFLRFVEEIAMPFRISDISIEKNMVEGAAKRISFYSPHWALASIFRLGNAQVVDTIFTRQFILQKDSKEVEYLIERYFVAFEELQKENTEKQTYIIPEILSRLCVKCSDESKFKILIFLKVLYLSEKKQNFRGVSHLLIRLLNSCSLELKAKMFVPFLAFPLLDERDLGAEPFLDPFQILDITKERFDKYKIKISKDVVDDLLLVAQKTGSKRKRAIFRLGTLNELNLLNKNQQKAFGELLWLHPDLNTGFPKDTAYYNCSFINLPHPKRIDPKSVFKKYILDSSFPIQNLQTNNEKSIGITNGEIPLCKDILNGMNRSLFPNLEWTNEEILTIYNKILDWWNSDKLYLRNNTNTLFGSIAEEFIARFEHVNSIISIVIETHPDLFEKSDDNTKLKNLIDKLKEFGVPNLQAKVAFTTILAADIKGIFYLIENAFASKRQNLLLDAARAILKIIKLHKQNYSKIDIEQLLQLLSQQIKWRIPDTLAIALDTIGNVVERNSDLISQTTLSDILIGLEYLLKETNLTDLTEESDFGTRLLQRKYSANLTFKLKQYYTTLNVPTPQAIIDWQIACESSNEFDEIRIEWEK